ncbi:MAG: hypothetical protein V4517_20700 [Pseudomonadota bacterium]
MLMEPRERKAASMARASTAKKSASSVAFFVMLRTVVRAAPIEKIMLIDYPQAATAFACELGCRIAPGPIRPAANIIGRRAASNAVGQQ